MLLRTRRLRTADHLGEAQGYSCCGEGEYDTVNGSREFRWHRCRGGLWESWTVLYTEIGSGVVEGGYARQMSQARCHLSDRRGGLARGWLEGLCLIEPRGAGCHRHQNNQFDFWKLWGIPEEQQPRVEATKRLPGAISSGLAYTSPRE